MLHSYTKHTVASATCRTCVTSCHFRSGRMASVVQWQECAFHADWRKSNPETSLTRLLLIQNVAGCLHYPARTRVAHVSGIAVRELVLWRVGCVPSIEACQPLLLVYWRWACSSVPPPAALECTRFAPLVNDKTQLLVPMKRVVHTRPEPWQAYRKGRSFLMNHQRRGGLSSRSEILRHWFSDDLNTTKEVIVFTSLSVSSFSVQTGRGKGFIWIKVQNHHGISGTIYPAINSEGTHKVWICFELCHEKLSFKLKKVSGKIIDYKETQSISSAVGFNALWAS